MPHVSISVNGRDYRITCGQGEEDHVTELSRILDEMARGLTGRLGHVSEGMALVMVGLTLADELAEVRREVDLLRDRQGSLDNAVEEAVEEAEDREHRLAAADQQAAAAIVAMASRIEALADRLDQA